MKTSLLKIAVLICFCALCVCNSIIADAQSNQRLARIAKENLAKWENPLTEFRNIGKVRVDSLFVNKTDRKIRIYYSVALSYFPIRENSLEVFRQSLMNSLGRRFRDYQTEIITNGFKLEQLIPNIYRKELSLDSSRIFSKRGPVKKLVQKAGATYFPDGLSDNSVTLWHSHGYYFDQADNRWKWQRARLFGTVEDISVMGYVLPYLVPMLENSGASVFLPRERDIQVNEVIVDNEKSTGKSEFILRSAGPPRRLQGGFLLTDTLFTGDNPFRKGTSLQIQNGSVSFIPEIPEKGEYAVYVSYPVIAEGAGVVNYTVHHTGGVTGFRVDQSIGGGTWIYLGTFLFNKSKNPVSGNVEVSGSGNILIDAIRFGGGMGNVARFSSPDVIQNKRSVAENESDKIAAQKKDSLMLTWKISNVPRYLEGSRYYLQYAGMPDSVYSPNKNKNDYNDDYQSRGLWVNYLTGGSPDHSGTKGLGIPVDLSVAFHTDAGITPNDSVIGTLAIYSTDNSGGKFPSGSSRMASRDLSDIIQTQVVDDIRGTFSQKWTRRGLWDRPYSEARRPDVPALLIELLSHQNQADQESGFDPDYKFLVCRAIYKGILKYLCYQENREYVVQPLPVDHFSITPLSGKRVRLSWSPVEDTKEPTSRPTGYRIYKRIGENGFDNGLTVETPFYETILESYDSIYSFKITALNRGGESFPSEILSVGLKENDMNPVLVVNGFDRVSGPAWFDKAGMAGVAWWNDRGVPYKSAISEVGDQFDFNRSSEWENDDCPGWGASYADFEGKIVLGNSFDNPIVHGKAIMAANHSFFSVSDESFLSGGLDHAPFKMVDMIFGEEKISPSLSDTTGRRFRIYSPEFMQKMEELSQQGTSFFISGAYVGTDLVLNKDSNIIKFAAKILHFKPLTGHAVKTGKVYATDFAKPAFTGSFNFNTGYSDKIYTVEAPDAIVPAGKGAISAFRYSETNTGAGVAFKGASSKLVLGFPFETIVDEAERNLLMKQVIGFLK